MDARNKFARMLSGTAPILALAPMQDITDLAFWRVLAHYSIPDVFFTEYFRVHPVSRLEKPILRSIVENPTGRPVVAQMIGNDIPSLVRAARELQQYPVAAIDLNLGCPAPIVYRKCAGGGLLRDLPRVDAILGALREAITIKFTVKTRIGFDSAERFHELLKVLARHSPDMVTIHGRTVQGMYRTAVDYARIGEAAAQLPCPVLANGNIASAAKTAEVLASTSARGVMLGRGVVRNPWVFDQTRQFLDGREIRLPTGREVLDYIRLLFNAVCHPTSKEPAQIQRMKKFTNFLGPGVDAEGRFLHAIQRVATRADFFKVCEDFLAHDEPMHLDQERFGMRLPVSAA